MCVSYRPSEGLAQKRLLCTSEQSMGACSLFCWGVGGGGLGRLRFLSLDNTQNVFFYEASPYDMRIGNFMTFLS